jgi:SAM-dependent methyltransferase
MRELLEISDLIVNFDLQTLVRLPVRKQSVVDTLLSVGDKSAARIVDKMPSDGEMLDPHFVDRLLVRVHCEMQRLSEEFQHGRRIMQLLQEILAAIRQSGLPGPYRIVDIGCGSGFVVRWIAAHGGFEGADLVGVDFNQALIEEAKRLAKKESLQCHFQVANAFQMDQPATIFISTAVLHHFTDHDALRLFFSQHDQPSTQCYIHYDFQPTILARPGSWLFHYVRMREPLARHDGVISARRAHSADVLLQAARNPNFPCGRLNAHIWNTPLPRVFHSILGARPRIFEILKAQLNSKLDRWESN